MSSLSIRRTGCLFFLLAGTAAGTTLFAQTVRQRETDAFQRITSNLQEKNIAYQEIDLLAGYGVFGKSVYTGEIVPEARPFLFTFPVSDHPEGLAFSLIDALRKEETPAGIAAVFLGDAWPDAEVSLAGLLEEVADPENTHVMHLAAGENQSVNVTFFQGTVKNPFHLTGVFAEYLKARGISFSFHNNNNNRDNNRNNNGNIVLPSGAFPGTAEAADFLLRFAKTKPEPALVPDVHYIAADFHRTKIIMGNPVIITTIVIAAAVFLCAAFFLSAAFPKKKAPLIVSTVLFIFAGVILLAYLFRPAGQPVAENDAPPAIVLAQGDKRREEDANITVEKRVLLDRYIYTVTAVFSGEPSRISLFYDLDKAKLPGEVYEAPFPYEVEPDHIAFTLGPYPPNPFETQISFPIGVSGSLRITALCQNTAIDTAAQPAAAQPVVYVWRENGAPGL
jgi:hypothetical protein